MKFDSPFQKSASAEITTEMCSSGLALPRKLLVEYIHSRGAGLNLFAVIERNSFKTLQQGQNGRFTSNR